MVKNREYYENLRVAVDLSFLDSSGIGLDNEQLSNLINETYPNFNNSVIGDDINIVLEPTFDTMQQEAAFIYREIYGETESYPD